MIEYAFIEKPFTPNTPAQRVLEACVVTGTQTVRD